MKILSIRNVLAVAVVGLLVGVAYITNPALFRASNAEAGTGQNVSGWAWSENTGWIGFNDTDIQSVCDANSNGFTDVACGGLDNTTTPFRNYGVKVDTSTKATGGTGDFSGSAWSDNVGWINFDAADVTGCPTAPCQAQVDWSTGKVTGWARALSGKNDPQAGGWDGWIKLSGTATDSSPYGVKISANKFSGYAWGGGDGPGVAGVVGWIDFAPTVGGIPMGAQISAPPCTVADVNTSGTWGTCQALTQCTGVGTQQVMGIKIGLCASGGTVTDTCGPFTQQCAAASGSGSGGPVKLKYKQF